MRIKELADESLRAASPAAYEETRPFPAPENVAAEGGAAIGTACASSAQGLGPIVAGFTVPPRFIPVVSKAGLIAVREKGGVRFAFLLSMDDGNCQIRDAVVLPAQTTGDTFLQCAVVDPPLAGFGVRDPKTHGLYAFWSIEADTQIHRVPMGVLGVQGNVKCHQPESGE